MPEVMTISPNGFWHLSLPHSLFLGGVHNLQTLPTSLREKGSFVGCIQKIEVNNKQIAIISEALGGSNVDNCPHACIARPCGPLASCIPNMDSYECQCNPQNAQCNKAEELSSDEIEEHKSTTKMATTTTYEADEYDMSTENSLGELKSDEDEQKDDYEYDYVYDEDDYGTQSDAISNFAKDNNEKIIVRIDKKGGKSDTFPPISTTQQTNYDDRDNDEEKSDGKMAAVVGSNENERDETTLDNDDDDYFDENEEKQFPSTTIMTSTTRKIDRKTLKSRKKKKFSELMKNFKVNGDAERDGHVENGKIPRISSGKHTMSYRPEDDTVIDEILIDEMDKIMKNKDGDSIRDVIVSDGDDDNEDEDMIDDNVDEIEIEIGSHDLKYGKNKYFRKYHGACFTGTDSYFHYSDAETMRRVISYEIDLNLRFKTHSSNGLILWTGRHSALEGDDFLSLGVENG